MRMYVKNSPGFACSLLLAGLCLLPLSSDAGERKVEPHLSYDAADGVGVAVNCHRERERLQTGETTQIVSVCFKYLLFVSRGVLN